MALGGNPVFNGKNFRSQTRGGAPTVPAGGPFAGQDPMSPQDLQNLYSAPAAGPKETGRMTYDDVIMKTFGCLAVVLLGA
ncbi:MAG: hypothetical protein ABS909_01230, partial [Arthrobacter sp.]